jgi:putative Holliday junction resolvase
MSELLALDIGRRKVGVARANSIAKLPEPVGVWAYNEHFVQRLQEYILSLPEPVEHLLVGLPRGMDGAETAQTAYTKHQADHLAQQLGLALSYIDETLTSLDADSFLAQYPQYDATDNDAVAAAIILQRYFIQQQGAR